MLKKTMLWSIVFVLVLSAVFLYERPTTWAVPPNTPTNLLLNPS
ncbi:hypothetical protein SAMN04488112_102206 [Melghirimyces thermohalophilus]|uniref:Uncharacterized protein n=1 Tax=Melghirimyces thermohalophilus TaxID=1236220 RepID=A0A1G6IEV3_9BACL|nr:hypothetical protein SAMN04488112_102206 [Melghirimyces thermohalophilus]